MCPSAVTAIASATPFASATSNKLGSPAIATETPAPIPMKKKKNAPMNSATLRNTASSGSSQSIPPVSAIPPPEPTASGSSTTTAVWAGSFAGACGSSTAAEHKGFAGGLSLPSSRASCQDHCMETEHLSDGDLVSRCRQGDQAAWAALVERYSRY